MNIILGISFPPQDLKINKIAQMPLAKVVWFVLLRLVSEACQTTTNAEVSIECHWLVCIGSHLAGIPRRLVGFM